MVNGIETGQDLGYIKEDPSIFIDRHEINNYKPEEVLILCTGSQGEPFAALNRPSPSLSNPVGRENLSRHFCAFFS